MFSDAIRSICAAEEAARITLDSEREKARAAIMQAKEDGERAIARTLARSESEIAHMIRTSDNMVTEDARELASKTANRQAMIRARAERRLDAAAQLIVERIVKI